jgi:hypothetical protein
MKYTSYILNPKIPTNWHACMHPKANGICFQTICSNVRQSLHSRINLANTDTQLAVRARNAAKRSAQEWRYFFTPSLAAAMFGE